MRSDNSITIVQMNDSHAYFEPHQELFWTGIGAEYKLAGGYARVAATVNAIRRERPGRVVFCDCGDTIHGTFTALETKGMAMVPVLNELGLDAMAAHWEFAYGPQQFSQIAGQLNFPVLGANVYDETTGELMFPAYTVIERAGLRVGIIGVDSNIVDKTMPASFSTGVRFTLGRERLPEIVAKVRGEEKADVVIVISHLGFPQDHKLAGEVKGIDVLLSGHTHNRLYFPVMVGPTAIIQSGCHGSFLGRLDLRLEAGKVTGLSHALLPITIDLPSDEAVNEVVESAVNPFRERLSEEVGETGTALNRNTVLEATTDNLLLQALTEASNAELAFSNGWRYGAPVPVGKVVLNDLYNFVPMNPPVTTVEITGAEVRQMLEENLEHTFAHDPYDQMGGYLKRCLGLRLCAKIENPAGHRVQEIFVREQPLSADRVYTAVFVTDQGVPRKFGTNRREIGMNAVDALRRYLSSHRPAQAEIRGTVVAV